MARLRREPDPGPAPANLERFRLGEWYDADEPVPDACSANAGAYRHMRAFRRYLEAKRAWRNNGNHAA